MDQTKIKLLIISRSPEETASIGKIIGEHLCPGDIVALNGELGSGKTCLTQGIAIGLEVPEQYAITSPTFTLINEYPGKMPLYHFDLYRILNIQDMESTGYDEYFFGKGVSVIEWADRMTDMFPPETISILFRYLNENQREIIIEGTIAKVDNIIRALKNGGF